MLTVGNEKKHVPPEMHFFLLICSSGALLPYEFKIAIVDNSKKKKKKKEIGITGFVGKCKTGNQIVSSI